MPYLPEIFDGPKNAFDGSGVIRPDTFGLDAINASISAIERGRFLVIHSTPVGVMSMSSSMRTPMFLYFSKAALTLAIKSRFCGVSAR